MRTVKDFVRDLKSEGKNSGHIIAVARNTRWKDNEEEIKKLLKTSGKKRKIIIRKKIKA